MMPFKIKHKTHFILLKISHLYILQTRKNIIGMDWCQSICFKGSICIKKQH